ncbi:hypothetical protein QVD17_42324 [Tagetes erecta]|uniref:Uncharacterized protein n=1 Tax=Tagetes erecta TaxID=13708 RepID=A0AAD8JLJ7_TARER|nr:hypothetical protein QVD17_42324 [Tagetes erecta]
MGILGVRFFFFSYLRYFELDEQIAPKSSQCLKEKEELTKPKEYRAKHAVFSRQAAIKSWEKGFFFFMIVDVLTHAQDPLMVVRLASLSAFPRPKTD